MMAGAVFNIWRLVPSKMRIVTYKALRTFGERLYGRPDGTAMVQRLPFGLYLKYYGGLRVFHNEFNAKQVGQRHTTTPAPRPLDLVSNKGDDTGSFSSPNPYLLTTRVPGVPLWRCEDFLSSADCADISLQLADLLASLHGIPKTVNTAMAISTRSARHVTIRASKVDNPWIRFRTKLRLAKC